MYHVYLDDHTSTSTGKDIMELSNMDLRLSSKFQHFHLCGAAANEIGNNPKFQLEIRTYNYVHSMVEVRELAKAITDQNGKFLFYTHTFFRAPSIVHGLNRNSIYCVTLII